MSYSADRMRFDLTTHALAPLSSNESQQPRNRTSFAPVEGSSPTAGIGTADAGTPIVRYWTVRYRYAGSVVWGYTHVVACDPFKAFMVVSKQKPTAAQTEVVREIQRDEYEHLTK